MRAVLFLSELLKNRRVRGVYPRRVLGFVLVMLAGSVVSGAQGPSLPVAASRAYTLTGVGGVKGTKILRQGTVYVARTSGLIGHPLSDGVTPTNTVVDGRIQPPKGLKAGFGAVGATRVAPGERFYLTDVEATKDAVVFTMLSEKIVKGLVMVGTPPNDSPAYDKTRMQLYVRFPMTPQQRAALTAEAVHAPTDPIFAAATPQGGGTAEGQSN